MTTIDHQQAAVDGIRMWLLGLGSLALDEVNDLAPKFVTAATPHLRAAWGQPIRELCEAAIKRANDPLAARGFYGEAFPATVYAQDILALLEGGDNQ